MKKIKKEASKVENNEKDFNITKMKLPNINFDKSYTYLGIAILAVVILLYFGFLYMQSVKFIDYNGLKFEKTQTGSIVLYTTKIPAMDYATNKLSYLTIDFRSDPRTLDNIPVNIQQYLFKTSNITYISFENSNHTYEDGTLAAANLGRFLNILMLNVKSAMSDKSFRNNTNLPYVTCNTNPNNTVIMLYEGSKSSISQVSENCYILVYTNKDILRVTEKFQLSIIEKIMDGTGQA